MRRRSDFGELWGIAMALLEKPLTAPEVMERFQAVGRRFGFLGPRLDIGEWLQDRLQELVSRGWAVRDGERYALTDTGREEAGRAQAEVERARGRMNSLLTPQNASKLALAAHLVLAALKLPAGILSGSVGLLNDAIDTLLDGISSLLVYWGLKVKRERLVSRLLVLFMLATGGIALVEAVLRILRREPVQADWFAFSAVLTSAVVCGVLWFVQRFVGLRRRSMALIAQSVDSRNHVIVAGGVTVGLVAALLRFAWLDYLVGLAVSLLILKSAVELAIELIRSRGEQAPNLSRFGFGIYERFRRSQLSAYLLYLVRSDQADTRQRLLAEACKAFDFQGNVLLQSMGAERLEHTAELISSCYDRLIRDKLLIEGQCLELTAAGERAMAGNRFFLDQNTPLRFKVGVGGVLRISFSLLVRWILFFVVYWLAATWLLPRLPALPLWDSIDLHALSVAGLPLTRFDLVHLAAGFLLVSLAATLTSLIHQRHPSVHGHKGSRYAKLQTDGFYGRLRHPLAAARLLDGLGFCFAFRTAWAILPFAFLLLSTILSVVLEERRQLAPRFGDAYEQYRQAVRLRCLTPWVSICLGLAAAAFAAGLIL